MEIKRIFIDISETYLIGLNTGIQRVARNITKELINRYRNDDLEIIPFVCYGKYFRIIDKKEILNNVNNNKMINFFKKICFRLLDFLTKISIFHKIVYFIEKSYFTFNFLVKYIKNNNLKKVLETIDPKKDIILVVDSFFASTFFPHLKFLKLLNNKKGKDIKILTILYDIIPLTHNYHSKYFIKKFKSIFFPFINRSNKIVCISKSVADELINYFRKNKIEIDVNKIVFNYLGADIIKKEIDLSKIPQDFKEIFSNTCYITVSTLEPRKNHENILNAFEILWKKGYNINWVIIGRIGWEIKDFIKRLNNHPENNKKLLYLGSIPDDHLIFAYKNAKATIMGSFVEGFGLPIIEAFKNKCPVIASDIPVFREIAKDNVYYFDPYNFETLVNVIEKIEKEGIDPRFKNIEIEEYTWEKSADGLFKIIKSLEIE